MSGGYRVSGRRIDIGTFTAVAVITVAALIVYCLTCFRTITWWENPEMALAAVSFGILYPPGCLLGIILGWIVTKLAVCGSYAFSLNLLAAATAAATAVLVGLTAIRLHRRDVSLSDTFTGTREAEFAVLAGAAIGGLAFAFGDTMWSYAVMFTPYIFTVLFTIIIFGAMLAWWDRAFDRKTYLWLGIVSLLIGLDFSIHRTNFLLIPGFLLWILIRRPKMYLSAKTYLYGLLGFIIGLAFHLVLIPMAARDPIINAGDPSTLARFWDYISMKQAGGGFLIDLFPRKGFFWDYQVMDFIRGMGSNFFAWRGKLPLLGILPGILGLFGLVRLWTRRPRLAAATVMLFVVTAAVTVVYFNIPANFFRSMFRHYLPCMAIFAVWVAYATGRILRLTMTAFPRSEGLAYGLAVVLLLAVPGYRVYTDFQERDRSENYFTYDYAFNLLNVLPENAILITFGDGDTFSPWYLQGAEGFRTDVTVANNWLLNLPWYQSQVQKRQPGLPLDISDEQSAQLQPLPWADTTIMVAVEGTAADFNLADSVTLPDSIALHVAPTVNDRFILVHEWLLLRMIVNNAWRRPVYFSVGGFMAVPSWVREYLRPEGLAFRLVPVPGASNDTRLLRDNLVNNFVYRGFADESVVIDGTSRTMASGYMHGFITLITDAINRGDTAETELLKNRVQAALPLDRIRPLPGPLDNAIEIIFQENNAADSTAGDTAEVESSRE